MNIDKIKELGQLEKELNELNEKFKRALYKKKSEYLDKAAKDFEIYFKSKDFDVRRLREGTIEASYGNVKVCLNMHDVANNYIGAYLIFDFKVQVLEKREYKITLNRIGNYPRVESSVRIESSRPKTEEEKLIEKIEITKKLIDEIKNRLQNIDTEEWGYRLESKDGRNYKNSKQYKSIKELLEDYFK